MLPDMSRRITRLICRGRTIAMAAAGEAARFSLHVPVCVGAEAEDVEEGVAPESVEVALEVEGSGVDPDEPVLANAATGGPGKVYVEPGLKTLGSKIPGSVSL
jgi:hypothetical protein